MLKDNVRKLLAKYGQTQTDLANILGITYQSISIKLNGKSSFTLNEIILITEVYGLSPQEVYDIFIKDAIERADLKKEVHPVKELEKV